MTSDDRDRSLGVAADAAGLSPTVEPASSLDGFATSIPNAGDEDMSWFLIAVGRRPGSGYRDCVILDYAKGWQGFDVEFYWEDTFEIDAPDHLEPGCYRWLDFQIGYWGEDERLNVSGGRFEPYTAQGMSPGTAVTGTGSGPKDGQPGRPEADAPVTTHARYLTPEENEINTWLDTETTIASCEGSA